MEEVLSVGTAVGADKCVMVAPYGWTDGAHDKAVANRLDLRLFTIQEALRMLDIKYWLFCPACNNDCIILDQAGMSVRFNEHDVHCIGGRCRECRATAVRCAGCNKQLIIRNGDVEECLCLHGWNNSEGRLFFRYTPSDPVWIELDKLN